MCDHGVCFRCGNSLVTRCFFGGKRLQYACMGAPDRFVSWRHTSVHHFRVRERKTNSHNATFSSISLLSLTYALSPSVPTNNYTGASKWHQIQVCTQLLKCFMCSSQGVPRSLIFRNSQIFGGIYEDSYRSYKICPPPWRPRTTFLPPP